MLLPELLLLSLLSLAVKEPIFYFKKQFLDREGLINCWIEFKHKSNFGKYVFSASKFYSDLDKDKGLQTSQDAHFLYALSARFEHFSNKDQTLVVQLTKKHKQNIDHGSGQVKLFPDVLDQTDMKGDTEYSIMSGPDIYGPRTKKGHVIFNYKCKNMLINKDIHCKDDEFIHLTHSLCGLITPMR